MAWRTFSYNIKWRNKKKILIKQERNAYSYQIEFLSNSIIDKKKDPNFPGMTIDNTLENMKILDMWRS